MVRAAHADFHQPPPLSIRPPRHEQRETWGQASFGPLGTGRSWAGGTGTGVTTPHCPQRGVGAGQDGASPPPAKSLGLPRSSRSTNRDLKDPKKARSPAAVPSEALLARGSLA